MIAIYILQIIVLLMCVYMIWRVRHELNGLTRGLIALCLLLIVRRVDDALGIFSEIETVVLSTAVVMVFAIDLYDLYKMRDVLQTSRILRKRKEAELELIRRRNEEMIGKSWDIR